MRMFPSKRKSNILDKLEKPQRNEKTPERKVVDILKQNSIDIAATLPCDRIKALLLLIARNIRTIPLTREENGIGICAGVYLGGGRPVMVIPVSYTHLTL